MNKTYINKTHSVILLFSLMLAACQSNNLPSTVPADSAATSINLALIPMAAPEQIEQDVRYLADDRLNGRVTGTDGIEIAATYLSKRLEKMGVAPLYESYMDRFEVGEKQAFNVVSSLSGSDPVLKHEIILIGAHYDHIKIDEPKTDDSIANGANDNATGTATVLALAEKFAHLKDNRRTIVFALFSAEELGLLGSKHLANRMKTEGKNVVAVVNFEMTGIPMLNAPYTSYLTGHDQSNMADILNRHSQALAVTGKLALAAEYNLFRRSDNYPFFTEYAIPAHTISTFDFTNFEHYHQVGDEADLIDFTHMASLVDMVFPGIVDMVDGASIALTPAVNSE